MNTKWLQLSTNIKYELLPANVFIVLILMNHAGFCGQLTIFILTSSFTLNSFDKKLAHLYHRTSEENVLQNYADFYMKFAVDGTQVN
jgi:hypothetical protein